jgi:hypothetical protein
MGAYTNLPEHVVGRGSLDRFCSRCSTLIISGVPVAAGIAILKYRLYDIERITNRTIVCASVTATLLTPYFIAIVPRST